jgi:hypothetical protein
MITKNYVTKKLSGILVMVIIILAGVLTVPGIKAFASDINYATATIPTIEKFEDMSSISAMYTTAVSSSSTSASEAELSYFKFTLDSDSWVYFTGSFSANNHDGGQIHVNLYADAAMTNAVFDYGWGYWEYTKEYMDFLKKGTYYGRVSSRYANYDRPFVANVNVIAGAIPTSAVLDAKIKVSSDGKKATVSFADVLGEKMKNVQYRAGKVDKSYNDSWSYWKYLALSTYYGPKDAHILEAKDGRYSFTVKKNGYYTIRLKDNYDNYYSKVIKVSGISSSGIKISGVSNGKTYNNAVTVKFSAPGSKIKSATLNGKAVKSGKKVSSKGSYTLKVTDKSGNKKTVKFTIN